jgi:hypothetical protein
MSKIQVIKCKCGSIFAACVEEECYIDKEWTRELRKYVLKGCTVDMIDKTSFEFQKCTCNKETSQLELFSTE